jgi:hypothetical protein
MEPAPLTLPPGIESLLFVNNTVNQPRDVGIVRIFDNKAVENYELNLDSISWIAINALASEIEEARVFDRVSFYRKLVRKDSGWINNLPLSPELKDKFIEEQGFDAIISLDKILFTLDEQVKIQTPELSSYLPVYAIVRTGGGLRYSIYAREKDAPLFSGIITDSLLYQNSLYADSVTILKELPESLINELAYTLGQKMAYLILPSWTMQDRIIYRGNGARMLEALSYAKTGKWDTSEILWLSEFEKKTKNRDRALIANNIAVANEMKDNLEVALRWAEKAREYAVENSGEQSLFQDYVSGLQKRIQDDPLLNDQTKNR